jgi:hypothetical protein
MPHSVLKSLREQLSHVREILLLNDDLRTRVQTQEIRTSSELDPHYWRQYDYCAAVIRLYASFERFVIDAVQKWTDWHASNGLLILSGSDRIIKSYRHGVAEILKRSTEPRFSKVNLATLVEGLALLQQGKAVALSPYALFAAMPNLRFGDVLRVLETVEITQAAEWFNSYTPLMEHFQDAGDTPESFLKELVARRNEAAHGNELPDDMLSTSLLMDAVDSICILAAALTELITARMVATLNGSLPENAELGEVTEVFAKAGAMILTAKGNSLTVNEPVWVATGTRCYPEHIKSIQINGKHVEACMPDPSQEIGIQLAGNTKRGSKLLSARSMPWLPHPALF